MGWLDWLRGAKQRPEPPEVSASEMDAEIDGPDHYEALVRRLGALFGLAVRARCVLELERGRSAGAIGVAFVSDEEPSAGARASPTRCSSSIRTAASSASATSPTGGTR